MMFQSIQSINNLEIDAYIYRREQAFLENYTSKSNTVIPHNELTGFCPSCDR